MYGVDEISIDDNIFQISSYFTRSKKFLNVKSLRLVKDKRKSYADPITKNNPIFIMFFGLQKDSKNYDRKVYGILEMLGNVGGLVEILHVSSLSLVFLFCSNAIAVKFLHIF